MSPAAWIVVIAGAAVALAAVAWFFLNRKQPQNAPGRSVIVDRPAGPGAESQRVDERGTLLSAPAPADRRSEPDGV